MLNQCALLTVAIPGANVASRPPSIGDATGHGRSRFAALAHLADGPRDRSEMGRLRVANSNLKFYLGHVLNLFDRPLRGAFR